MNKNLLNDKMYEQIILRYGLKKTQDTINDLDMKKKQAIILHFKENKSYKEIDEILNLSNSNTFINRALKTIENKLQGEKLFSNTLNFNRLINEYGKEKVYSKINLFSVKTSKALKLYFGLEGNEKKTYKEINKILEINYSKQLVNKALKDIEEDLTNSNRDNKYIKSKKKFKKLIDQYGERKVLESIDLLNDKCKKVVNLYFGLVNNQQVSQKKISEILDIDDINKIIYYSLDRMKCFLEKEKDVSNKKLLSDFLIRNDRKAYEKLMEKNQTLINSCLEEYLNEENKEYKEDLFSAGCIGLHKAIVSCPKENVSNAKFVEYASRCIRKEISKELEENDINILSLEDEVINSDGEFVSLKEIIEDENDSIENFIEDDYKAYINKKVKEALKSRSPKTRLIIELYYGFDGSEGKTPEEISEKYNIPICVVNSLLYRTNRYLRTVLEEFNQVKKDNINKKR